MGKLIYLRTKCGTTIRFEHAKIAPLVSAIHDETGATLETYSLAAWKAIDIEVEWLRLWRDTSGFNPFTILRRINHKYRADVLSFTPAGYHSAKVKGRNGRYRIAYS